MTKSDGEVIVEIQQSPTQSTYYQQLIYILMIMMTVVTIGREALVCGVSEHETSPPPLLPQTVTTVTFVTQGSRSANYTTGETDFKAGRRSVGSGGCHVSSVSVI
jgi:hypothetical protein